MEGREIIKKELRIQSGKPNGCAIDKVQEVIHPISKCWDVQTLKSIVSPSEVDEICAIPISVCNWEDSITWCIDSKMQFSVRSGYRETMSEQLAHLSSNPSSSFRVLESVWKVLWNFPIPPKLINFCQGGSPLDC
ncbi:hypothetical protein CsSME_00015702 [Camellia sinensis var. sinensis]|uniref:Uncharacterized protein n=1 Tax=Camellia sinensis TaxID=4442 RepID=A0A7J7HPC6_CAMSI|nr:hypothetical protein HYC85_007588 [Camellia sinensis]